MQSKEEIEIILSKCDNCKLDECINCEMSCEDRQKIKEYITEIETTLKKLKRLQEENKDLKQANTEKSDKLIEITNLYLQSVSKDKIIETIEEMQEEYSKLDKQVDEYINNNNKDLNKYYENREKIGTMQTIGWAIGKIEELLEGK